ncbi:nitrous oxide-stimulated promoter family protein [Chloroflexota bacterium]
MWDAASLGFAEPVNDSRRLAREQQTVEAMIDLYCRGQHGTGDKLCRECAELRVYTRQRLLNCPFQEGKTTCVKCPTHCYKPEMREWIRTVMRYAGPRMLYRHPLMTVQHLIDGRREEPVRTPKYGMEKVDLAQTPHEGSQVCPLPEGEGLPQKTDLP